MKPFLSIEGDPGVRSFAAALPKHGGAAPDSPWTPKPAAHIAAPKIDEAMIANARDAAIAEGRAAGLAETEALRSKLRAMIESLDHSANARADHLAEQIADTAIAAIEAWLDRAVDRSERFAPAIRGWLRATGDGAGASAHVHPDDALALRAAIGDAKITVVEDAHVKPGDVHLASSTLELVHAWPARLAELRDVIAAAFTEHK